MKYFKTIISVVFISCHVNTAVSQFRQYKFTGIDVNKGLSDNKVTCFLKDNKGYMWFGTSSGLNRYDGYSIKVFKHDSRDSTSIGDNAIIEIFEDPDGRIWINTSMGYNVYDPATEIFYRNASVFLSKYGIPDGTITKIYKDKKGYHWFIHSSLGLFVYNPSDKKTTEVKHITGDTGSIINNEISNILEDQQGNYWIAHRNAMLEKIDDKNYKVIYRMDALKAKYKENNWKCNLMMDTDGDLWICMNYADRGISYYNTTRNKLTEINKDSPGLRLNTNLVDGIVQDNKGLIWVGTDHGGINIIDKKNHTVSYLMHNDEDEKSVGQNSIASMYKDDDGIIWIGTHKRGVSYFHENIMRFQHYKHHASNPKGLSYDDINKMAEDNMGNLWIGSNGGGLIYFDRKNDTFTCYRHDKNNPNSLGSDIIVSLCVDHKNKLWIGTFKGGLDIFDGKKFTHYKHNPADTNSVSNDNIWEIFEDSRQNIWIGTLGGGLDLYDRKKNTFSHYRFGDVNSVHANYISAITENKRNGDLWIGTVYGIDVLERKTGRFIHYINNPDDPGSLSNNSIYAILMDSRGWTWVATNEGLNLYDPDKKTFKAFRKEEGLPHNTINALLEDNAGNLWVSSPNGLCNIVISKDKKGSYTFDFKSYEESDGLQGKQFNDFSAFKTSRGELVFGGANGFNIFRPEDIRMNNNIPHVILSDFQIFNKSVKAGEVINGKVILEKSITETREIILDYDQNVFSIEFTALSFFHPEKNKYKYILEGFNKEWVTTDGKSRRVTYTNLDPGKYEFKVMASNNDGFWNKEALSLRITVLPPFWKTNWAFTIYIIMILSGLLLARRFIIQRARVKFRIEQERREAQRMHELDMMKIRFFTNVSHEFRTPLTLILTPLEKMLKNAKDSDQENQILVIYRNAKRLLNLVNELLDFRRMEVQEVRFNPSQGDIISFIEEVVNSFSDLSEKKEMHLSFQSDTDELETFFDSDKLERILFNLLSNAFKFTPEHGHITVGVEVIHPENNAQNGLKWLRIKVKDTGIGIPSEKHEKIFERFFQNTVPKSMVNQGSGIGLSITKEFVRIHGGTISIESEPGKGSCFTIMLPVKDISGETDIEVKEDEVALIEPDDVKQESDQDYEYNKKSQVLLVEDNEDFRFYLKDNLKEFYTILEARNGKEGWNKVLANIPDLLVCDVMMPEVNGIELCKKIRNDTRTSHIPIILLTARTSEEQKMEGFSAGANDYIAKPFNFEILLSRIKNLIVQQDLLKKAFRKQVGIKVSDIAITSLDEKLISNAIKCVEDNISNPDFSVEELSREMGMSRVYLYKKLLSLTNKSPIEFIRSIRLQQASQLLEKSQLTVAEVAYKVGFNNPKYFTKYFKKEYGVLPSVYATKGTKAT